MNNQDNIDIQLMLDNGFDVPDRLYKNIRLQVSEVAHVLEAGDICTLKDLCDPKYWASLMHGEQRDAGMCMVDMVLKNLVPYEFAGFNGSHHRLYRKK